MFYVVVILFLVVVCAAIPVVRGQLVERRNRDTVQMIATGFAPDADESSLVASLYAARYADDENTRNTALALVSRDEFVGAIRRLAETEENEPLADVLNNAFASQRPILEFAAVEVIRRLHLEDLFCVISRLTEPIPRQSRREEGELLDDAFTSQNPILIVAAVQAVRLLGLTDRERDLIALLVPDSEKVEVEKALMAELGIDSAFRRLSLATTGNSIGALEELSADVEKTDLRRELKRKVKDAIAEQIEWENGDKDRPWHIEALFGGKPRPEVFDRLRLYGKSHSGYIIRTVANALAETRSPHLSSILAELQQKSGPLL